MTVIDHMSYREEQYRLQLKAARDEADARARDARRAAGKLTKARSKLDAASTAAALASSGDGGGREGAGGSSLAPLPPPQRAHHAAAAAAAAAVYWFRHQPDFPAISHKVVAALAAPAALAWAAAAAGRPFAGVGPRGLLAAACFLLGYCASHWVALGAA
jgi:hypothetical protein